MDKARDRSAFNQQINAVEWSGTVIDEYGFHALTFLKEKIIAWGASTTLPILKKSSFEKLGIPVPPLEKQRAFAAGMAELDKLKAVQRSHLAKLDALFASLQHSAFRGELTVEGASAAIKMAG
jgi:type I restriction enzyme, S subunit